jgi:hypothetical protein
VIRPIAPSRLTKFRAWFAAFVVLSSYLFWVALVEYPEHLRQPSFVLPNLAVLFIWWATFVRTCYASKGVR